MVHFSAIHEPNHCSLLGVAHSDREWQTMLRLISSLNQSQGRLVNGYVSGHPNNTSLNTPRCRPKFQLLHGWAENFLNAPRTFSAAGTPDLARYRSDGRWDHGWRTVAGVTFSLPRRGRGNFSTLVNPKSCRHTRKENCRFSDVDCHGRNTANQEGIYTI